MVEMCIFLCSELHFCGRMGTQEKYYKWCRACIAPSLHTAPQWQNHSCGHYVHQLGSGPWCCRACWLVANKIHKKAWAIPEPWKNRQWQPVLAHLQGRALPRVEFSHSGLVPAAMDPIVLLAPFNHQHLPVWEPHRDCRVMKLCVKLLFPEIGLGDTLVCWPSQWLYQWAMVLDPRDFFTIPLLCLQHPYREG